MDSIGTYEQRRFPRSRTFTLDTLDQGRQKHHIPLLLEVDVTEARRIIYDLKERTGEGLSFTGWVVKCIAQAVSEHKYIHAMRRGRGSLIIFDDVDITVLVERGVGSRQGSAETLPMPFVVRRANGKSVREIHHEIRAAQAQGLEAGEVDLTHQRSARLAGVFPYLPKWLRNLLLWRRLARDPFFAKRTMGTVSVTSVGGSGGSSGSTWGIPTSIHPLGFALGAIARKPGVVGEAIEIREILSTTVLFDHDVTDGMPVARFIRRLQELMESGYGLVE